MFRIKIITLVVLICLVALFASTGYTADNFPSKPITVIVPFAPGGGTDMVLRPIMEVAEKYLGQPIVVEYKPGAGGVPALTEFAKAEPDGYTLMIVSATGFLVTPHLETLPYKFDDFQAIAQMVTQPYYFAVKGDSPWKTIDEFINTSKEASTSYKLGTVGVFSPPHLMVEILKGNYGANITSVPFEGGGLPLTATLGGHIDACIDLRTVFMQHVETGDLRLLACSSSERDPETPEVPTLKEKGYDIVMTSWKGFHGPSGIPPERIAFLEEAFKKISEDTEYKQQMEDVSGTINYLNSKDFQEYLEKSNQQIVEVLTRLGYEIK